MPTIKTKKEMNLPELIEWAWKNIDKVRSESFISNVSDVFGNYATVQFSVDGYGIKTEGITHKDTFVIELDEEITEDTAIPKIAELNLCGYDQHEELFVNENKSIKQLLSEEETNNKAFYVMNDDLTMTLIWTKEKGLVE